MRNAEALADGGTFSVHDVVCGAPRGPWSPAEETTRFALVLPRRGRFRRRVDGADHVVDAASGYFEVPGQEQNVAHPCDGGDACTVVTLSADLVASLCDDEDVPVTPVLPTPAMDLRHRLLLNACRRGDAISAGDAAVDIVGGALGAAHAPDPAPRPAVLRDRRAVVERAREALEHDVTLTLPRLASIAGSSPHHLSRVFKSLLGCSVTGYRNRLRLRMALDLLTEDGASLARVAAESGFADHAHLTRVARRHLGHTPSVVRAALKEEAS